mmetsp:Transcript_35213/g.56576  ORF Transcript_35213/g.56576 Transcript_35213/m.56576 type:complete len:95 (+) Transcript_35213:198-482(+)
MPSGFWPYGAFYAAPSVIPALFHDGGSTRIRDAERSPATLAGCLGDRRPAANVKSHVLSVLIIVAFVGNVCCAWITTVPGLVIVLELTITSISF